MHQTTTFYYQKYGNYAFFSYLMSNCLMSHVCQKALCTIFMEYSKEFHVKMVHARILSNILFNNHCKLMNPRSSKTKLKDLKLTEEVGLVLSRNIKIIIIIK